MLKLVASLEDESIREESGDVSDLLSALIDPARNCGLNSSWAENWDRIIPSWREAVAIILPTLIGAYCGLRYPIPEMGPVFFQSVVGAVIPFEIALGCVWLRFHKKQKRSASADLGLNAPASSVDLKNSSNKTPQRLPRAPAMLIIVLILFLSIMAFLALLTFVVDFKGKSLRGLGSDDVGAFGKVASRANSAEVFADRPPCRQHHSRL